MSRGVLGRSLEAKSNQACAERARPRARLRDGEGEVLSLAKTADRLNAKGYVTARGGKWHPTTVKNLLDRLDRLDRKVA